jgi:SAM-dependent methyltransferase
MNNLLHFNKRNSRHNGPLDLLRICWRQWWTEHALSRHQVHFRLAEPQACAAAYAAMTPDEFDAINGRQDWANWHTIPHALNGRLPNRPLRIADLGCGNGGSTRVLAYYCPADSRILGYELVPSLVDIARQRRYLHASERPVSVEFVVQEITQPLRQPNSQPLPAQSLDLVNASGVVGHHLTAETIQPLIAELSRVLKREGLALLDVGPTLPARSLKRLMTDAGFHFLGRYRSWLLDPNGQLLFQAK